MKLIVTLPSKAVNDPMIVEGNDYLKRARSPFSSSAIFVQKKTFTNETNSEKRKVLEGVELLDVTKGCYRIALSDHGKSYSSEQFAYYLAKLVENHQKIAFIIGGAFGLSSEVLNESAVLSLSAFTLPHRLAFLILAEQIYRAGEIVHKTPYHK